LANWWEMFEAISDSVPYAVADGQDSTSEHKTGS
jgi:hypothetical protein